MSDDMPMRGVLTDALAEHLENHAMLTERNIKFGDGRVNAEGGWVGDTPGQGAYIATTTLHTGPAGPIPGQRETVRSQHTTWSCQYRVKTIGGARTQADNGADRVRKAVMDFPIGPITLAGEAWAVQRVGFAAMAPVAVDGPTDAQTFSVEDTFEVWVVRARG